jgi:hypothetical protein
MSERDYFSLRYTVPGFVIFLLVMGMNYGPIYNILSRQGVTDVSGIALSLLSLFASSAVGFLISQVWFKIYHHTREWANLLGKEPIYQNMPNTLNENIKKCLGLGWEINTKGKLNLYQRIQEEKLAAAIDYILNKQPDNITKFLHRKIDLYHTMSCVLISLLSGLLIGVVIRLVCVISSEKTYICLTKFDLGLYWSTVILAIIFILIFYKLRKEILFEYQPMIEIVLNQKLNPSSEGTSEKYIDLFKRTFQDLYPEDTDNESTKIEYLV